jgi:hypothetical protein
VYIAVEVDQSSGGSGCVHLYCGLIHVEDIVLAGPQKRARSHVTKFEINNVFFRDKTFFVRFLHQKIS